VNDDVENEAAANHFIANAYDMVCLFAATAIVIHQGSAEGSHNHHHPIGQKRKATGTLWLTHFSHFISY
jgi:hypothetical protein